MLIQAQEKLLTLVLSCRNKLEDELVDPIEGTTGKTLAMFKLFKDCKMIDKDMFISNYDSAQDDITILAATGFSDPHTFKRFKKPYEYAYWGYYGSTTDAIGFIPTQNVILCGFTLYSTDQPQFQIKYKIYVDDNVVEEDEMTLSEYEDKYYKRLRLKGFHEIKAGSLLEITCQIAKDFSGSDQYVSCFYGEGGSEWETVENEHMGLWKVEASSKSGSSSVGYGNFPELMYFV